MEKEIPIIAASLSRFLNQKWLKRNKASICICGDVNYGWSEKVICEECRNICYYSEDNKDFQIKDIKKICVDCALRNHKKDLKKEQIEILENLR